MANIGEEKRRFPRIATRVPLCYQIRGAPKTDAVIASDLSLVGISFINNFFIQPNSVLILEIKTLPRPLRHYGKVVRSINIAHSDRYKIGVELIEMSAENRGYLSEFIKAKNHDNLY